MVFLSNLAIGTICGTAGILVVDLWRGELNRQKAINAVCTGFGIGVAAAIVAAIL